MYALKLLQEKQVTHSWLNLCRQQAEFSPQLWINQPVEIAWNFQWTTITRTLFRAIYYMDVSIYFKNAKYKYL